MRVLIVEDDFASRRILQAILEDRVRCDVVVDGQEAIDAFRISLEENDRYDCILLDIMMPNIDGQEALKEIRRHESEVGIRETDGVKVIMTSALQDPKNVVNAYYDGLADAYMVKPIEKEKLIAELAHLGFDINEHR